MTGPCVGKKDAPLWLDLGPEASVGSCGMQVQVQLQVGLFLAAKSNKQEGGRSSQIQKRLAPPLMGLSNHPSPSRLD